MLASAICRTTHAASNGLPLTSAAYKWYESHSTLSSNQGFRILLTSWTVDSRKSLLITHLMTIRLLYMEN